MRLVLSRRPPPSTSCQRWNTVATTSPPEGPINSTVDHYQADVRIGTEDTASATFDRIRNRLFTYDMFPPWLIHHALCHPEPITEDTTIVQRVVLGPIALEMAVRVIAVWNRQHGSLHEAGFTYADRRGTRRAWSRNLSGQVGRRPGSGGPHRRPITPWHAPYPPWTTSGAAVPARHHSCCTASPVALLNLSRRVRMRAGSPSATEGNAVIPLPKNVTCHVSRSIPVCCYLPHWEIHLRWCSLRR